MWWRVAPSSRARPRVSCSTTSPSAPRASGATFPSSYWNWLFEDVAAEQLDADTFLLQPAHRLVDGRGVALELALDPTGVVLDVRSADVREHVELPDHAA